MNSYEIGEFKLSLVKKLINNPDIVTLIDHAGTVEYADDLIYENIYPFNRIPDTEQEVKTYITVTVNVPSISSKNDLIRNLVITIRAYTHQSLMRVAGKGMTRIDLLGAKIDEIMNESHEFGIGYVKLVSNTEHVLDANHMYRELMFRTDDLNNKRV